MIKALLIFLFVILVYTKFGLTVSEFLILIAILRLYFLVLGCIF